MSNLILNAINYTSSGNLITVRTYLQAGTTIIEIHDEGIGIGKADLPHIFDRFYRADKARNTYQGGTGLGLSIVKKIIELHNGTIEVVSTPGKGSTFSVQLPIT